jgi:hypothetical protein
MKVNTNAKSFLSGLVSKGSINNGDWSFSTTDGNKLLGPDGDDWARYGKVHLAINPDAEKGTKDYYGYPVGKMVGDSIQIFRRGVIAAKAAAAGARGAAKQPDIEAAANSLLEAIDKKQKKEDSVYRIDFLEMADPDSDENYMEEKFVRTPEGFLKGRAIVTNVGVFPYRLANGTIRNELRPPEEVFSNETMASLKNIPLSNEHPEKGIIDIDNIKSEQVGYTGDEVRRDEYHLSISIIITDAETIEDVREGKRGLSCGYKVDIEEKSGVWMGIPYDVIQRNIRKNHLSIVDQGRAGDNARIKMDSVNAVGVQEINNQGVKSMAKKITIDGVEYEAEAPVITAYTRAKEELEKVKTDSSTEIETLKTDSKKVEAERDQLKEENEQLKKDAADFEKTKPEELEKAVEARLVILDAAKRAEVEVKEDMSEKDIKKEVVVKLFPNSKERMDEAKEDDVYINARFDMCLEKLDEMEEDRQDTSDHLKSDSLNKDNPKKQKNDAAAAYQRMVERDANAWKTGKKEE